jgi:hypothetical protein
MKLAKEVRSARLGFKTTKTKDPGTVNCRV